MKLNAHNSRVLLAHISLEAGEKGQENHNFEGLLLCMCASDPCGQVLDDAVLLADEELVLDVDEVLGSGDEREVGCVDRLFFLQQSLAPGRRAPKQLMGVPA
jgi:hypothetical protein